MAVDGERKVCLGEVRDDVAFLVTDNHGQIDEAGIDGNGADRCWSGSRRCGWLLGVKINAA